MSSNPLEELFASTPEDLAGTEPDENVYRQSTTTHGDRPVPPRLTREAAPCASSKTRLASLTHTCRTSNAAVNVQARRSCPAWPRTTTYRCKTFLRWPELLKKENAGHDLSAADIRRSFRFVLDDPSLVGYQKPTEDVPIEAQRFVVQLYQHFTGKRLLE